MAANRFLKTAAIAFGPLLGLAGAGIGIYLGFLRMSTPEPKEPLAVRIDTDGPYVILATESARVEYAKAIETMRELHPQAAVLELPLENPESLLDPLREIQPRYALIAIKPDELDINFAWRWLGVSTRFDEDPLVDVSTGFLTGTSPDAAAQFADRIAAASRGELPLPGKLIDNLGPNMQAPQDQFNEFRGCMMIPVYEQRVATSSISHGPGGFPDGQLSSLQDAGIVHFGGHGYPDCIVDGLSGRQTEQLQLPPSVVFNGACYTGVTQRWFEQRTAAGTVSERTVAAEDCFCLNLLQNSVIGYLAALHPDHGIPVYQEMEYLAYSGASLGDVMRHTHDGVIIANGGTLPALEPFADGMPSPQWTPSDVMLKGTAARVLFGDPSLIVSEAFIGPPFEVSIDETNADELQITAVLVNAELKSEFSDTYHADLASNPQLFNDRALVRTALPDGWESVTAVEVASVRAAGQDLSHRLAGFAVETDAERRMLHVQVDVPTTGYMQSPFRHPGAEVVLKATR